MSSSPPFAWDAAVPGLPQGAAARLDALEPLYAEWNAAINVISRKDFGHFAEHHVLHSLAVFRAVPFASGSRILDVGTGGGFPGIPLAIVEPHRQFTLIESTGKKCRFLEHVRDALELKNVAVVQSRAESYKPDMRFDTVLARAVGPVADLVKVAGPLVVGGGRLLAMKGRYPEQELAARLDGWKVAAVHPLSVPGLGEERHLVELCRSHDKTD